MEPRLEYQVAAKSSFHVMQFLNAFQQGRDEKIDKLGQSYGN